MKKIFLGAAVVFSAGLAGVSLLSTRAVKSLPANVGVAQPAERDDVQGDVNALKREVATLKRMAIEQATQTAAGAATKPTTAEPNKGRPRVSSEAAKRAFTDAMEGRFKTESIDVAWSAPRVQEIRGAFAQTLPDMKVVAAECLSTMCKVEVEHPDLDNQGTLFERTSEAEALGAETFFVFHKESDPPRTTLYMGRNGHKLPRPTALR